ncbi:hyalin-like [Antedon mediterranea]|uniref:hyalin-like n=1 Tax=Antedon mediterranea TaxID=105859 RepID=UPI003AF65060
MIQISLLNLASIAPDTTALTTSETTPAISPNMPQITFDNCPADETIHNTGAFPYGYTVPTITATVNPANLPVDVQVTSQPAYTPGVTINFGVNVGFTFQYTASATGAMDVVCEFYIRVVDKQAPYIIDCPMDMIVNTTTGEAFAINVTWMEPSATDNSGETPVPVADYTSGDNMFPIGETTVQYNVFDSSGNFNGSCNYVVTVEDNENPMIGCPANVTSTNYIGEGFGLVSVRTDQGSPNSTVTWDPPVASDNSNGTVTVVSSPYESGDILPIGIHTLTFTATDPYGNNDTCEFYIEVEDVEPPNPTCPSIAYGVADPESPNGTVSFNITVVDNVLVATFYTNHTLVSSSAIDMVSYTFKSTGVFPIGETIVEYTFHDNASPTANQASCYVKVQITDQEAPDIINCPKQV